MITCFILSQHLSRFTYITAKSIGKKDKNIGGRKGDDRVRDRHRYSITLSTSSFDALFWSKE